MTDRDRLFAVHCARMRAHWGKNYDVQKNWPQTEAEWRQAPHGAPWDTNVHMASWHLNLAQQIKDEGLLR